MPERPIKTSGALRLAANAPYVGCRAASPQRKWLQDRHLVAKNIYLCGVRVMQMNIHAAQCPLVIALYGFKVKTAGIAGSKLLFLSCQEK